MRRAWSRNLASDDPVTRAEFITAVTEEIADAILKAQGMMDWQSQETPEQIAESIAAMVPFYGFSKDDEP